MLRITSKLATRISIFLLLIFLILPIFVVILLSLGPDRNVSFPPSGISLKWYVALFSENEWLNALAISLQISLLTTSFSSVFGLLGSVAIYDMRPRSPLSSLSFALLATPLFIPAIVMGIGLSRVTEVLQLPDKLAVALSLSVVTTPLFMICTLVSMQGVDTQLKNAAASLGANKLETFFLITLPLIRRGLAIGAFIAFLLAFDELVITLFVAPPQIQTLPIKFWSTLRFYTSPLVAPVSTIMLLAMVAVLTFTFYYGAKNEHATSRT